MGDNSKPSKRVMVLAAVACTIIILGGGIIANEIVSAPSDQQGAGDQDVTDDEQPAELQDGSGGASGTIRVH